jgi:hypothetical protein
MLPLEEICLLIPNRNNEIVSYFKKVVLTIYNYEKETERQNKNVPQQAVWQYGGATNIFSTFCPLIGFSSSRRIKPSCSSYHHLL